MPQPVNFASAHDQEATNFQSRPGLFPKLPLSKLRNVLKRDTSEPPTNGSSRTRQPTPSKQTLSGRVSSVGPASVLRGKQRPRQPTRQDSERRDNLEELLPTSAERLRERNAVSATRRRAASAIRPPSPPFTDPRTSAPEFGSKARYASVGPPGSGTPGLERSLLPETSNDTTNERESPTEPPPDLSFDDDRESESDDDLSDGFNEPEFQEELESRWILNLSMAFKDKSDREKFFVTYAKEPNLWLRLTVTCDYRHAPLDSLESDLKDFKYQRHKSARIYESIRDSLPEIQFYDTVTNLKLETSDDRLHVHVTEDVNEIIKYPPVTAVQHLDCKHVKESELHFDSHLSGFVYKVMVEEQPLIKKEIPGPDMVDEFLYEVNALYALQSSSGVIRFHGVVVDENDTRLKGLLISFGERGALVDILYEYRGTTLPWAQREQWAIQIVSGLADVHEHGFVQGDFTLSNIVVDKRNNAQIIDINRRGCPVGWEPPEFKEKIRNGLRISMYIGVKSDLFQLGMVLWALAVQNDEPESVAEELEIDIDEHPEVPKYFHRWVESCLSEDPKNRRSAKDLLEMLPKGRLDSTKAMSSAGASAARLLDEPEQELLDPRMAVNLDDIAAIRRSQPENDWDEFSYDDTTFAYNTPSSRYRMDSMPSPVLGRPPHEVHKPSDDKPRDRSGGLQAEVSLDHVRLPGPNDDDVRDERKFDGDEVTTIHAHRWTDVADPSKQGLVSEPQDYYKSEPYREPRKTAFDRTRNRFSPPPHQDSGFGMDETLAHMGGVSGRIMTPPLHQDSGFDESFAESFDQIRLGDSLKNSREMPDLAGVGGTFG